MKYRVQLLAKKISDKDRTVKITAVSAQNAKDIATMRYKGYNAGTAVRLGTQPSTVQTMLEIKDEFIKAMEDGNKNIAKRHEKTFYSTMANLQSEMDVVAFQMAKRHLPDLPILGK